MNKTILMLALLALPVSLPAQEESGSGGQPAPPMESEKASVTQHSVRIGGQRVDYRATAGTLHLPGEDGTDAASIFYIAYT